MRWLVHGKVTPAAAEALRRHGHETKSLAEISLADDAELSEVLPAAQKAQLELVSADDALIETLYEQGVPFNRSIVFLQLQGGDVEQDDAIDRLFKRYKRLSPGRLYTVTGTRVKIRQLPTTPK
jgi:hypothetical protein